MSVFLTKYVPKFDTETEPTLFRHLWCHDGQGAGEIELGVATGTYYGDGNYPVYAEMEGKRVKSIRIDFT